jgi:hypothetical protein
VHGMQRGVPTKQHSPLQQLPATLLVTAEALLHAAFYGKPGHSATLPGSTTVSRASLASSRLAYSYLVLSCSAHKPGKLPMRTAG